MVDNLKTCKNNKSVITTYNTYYINQLNTVLFGNNICLKIT